LHRTSIPPRPPLLFFFLTPRPPRPTLFPYTTLFRSCRRWVARSSIHWPWRPRISACTPSPHCERRRLPDKNHGPGEVTDEELDQDRKSTRLNSSHVKISYAVFCLKKKKKKNKD